MIEVRMCHEHRVDSSGGEKSRLQAA
jgi:hypothetical protein